MEYKKEHEHQMQLVTSWYAASNGTVSQYHAEVIRCFCGYAWKWNPSLVKYDPMPEPGVTTE